MRSRQCGRVSGIGFTAALLAIGSATAPGDGSSTTNPPVIAWVRFDDAAQAYRGTKYRFLGDGDLQVMFAVKPRPDQVLELLWGAKGDQREGLLTVNGRDLPALRHGGYDGFRWLRVPVPTGTTSDCLRLSLRRGSGRAAFFGEIRLSGPIPPEGRPPHPSAAAHLATVMVAPRATYAASAPIEAFPGMRALWDRAPPPPASPPTGVEAIFRRAEQNARVAAEGLYRCRRYVDGWLAHADPESGLIPRNLRESRDFWNGRDSGADNYPFMVLTAALTDRPLMESRLLDILRTEARLTARRGRLPDDYSFSKRGWRREEFNLDAAIFDGAEYVKDGLLPITEWLGPTPWSDRMVGIVDDIWKDASIETPFGRIPTLNFEVNGDLLQACSRLFWFTGDRTYLDWAIRLGDYYLLGTNHPTRDAEHLALGDHSCEVINGLSELYVAVARVAPEKREAYRGPLHELYDRVLAIGCNEHGLMYGRVNTRTGAHSGGLTDNWGYNYDGIYTAGLVDGTAAYLEAVRRVLGHLKPHYTGQVWQGGSADGYADSIEGAITLFNREPIESAGEWMDSEIRTLWAKQQADGVIEGWHGDGNFARTTLMYALWKTQGTHVEPWRADVRAGAVREGDRLFISLSADDPWTGRLIFDIPRHRSHLRLPMDYPRINQFPEWFTVEAGDRYEVRGPDGAPTLLRGKELREGLPVRLAAGREQRWTVHRVP